MRIFLLLFFFTASAWAQSAKPIRIVVPFPPGGTADALSRLAAERLSPLLGQQVLVENRAGAGGNLAAEYVFKADADGATLLSSPPHLLTVNPLLYKLAFDPSKFVPVGIIAAYPNVLVAAPDVPASTLAELVALAKKNPGKLNIASQGNGTISHLSAELLKRMAGIELVHVPYKGTAPAMTDLLGGQVQLMFDNLITTMPHIKAGKLKLLAVGGEKRLSAFPDVPALAETLAGFRSETWMGLVAPPGTPPAIAERYSSALARVVAEPEVKRRLVELQADPVGNTPDQMAAVIRQDLERWSQVIREAHIRVD